MGSEPEGTLRRRRTSLLIGSILSITLSLALCGAAAAQTSSADVDWDRLAQCSSNGVWNRNLGNGVYGGLSILQITWDGFGGRRYASRPDLASRDEQILVARRILAGQGWEIAWPGCGALLGYVPTRTPTDVTEASELPTTAATAPLSTGASATTVTSPPATTGATTAPATSGAPATSSVASTATASSPAAATTAASVPASSTANSSGGSIVFVIVLLVVVAGAIIVVVVSRRRRQEGAAWPARTEVEAIPADLVQQMFEQRRSTPDVAPEQGAPMTPVWVAPVPAGDDDVDVEEIYDGDGEAISEPLPPPRWQPARPPAQRPSRQRAAPLAPTATRVEPGVSSKRFVPALADAADRISHEQLTEQWRRADAVAADQQRRALESRLREVEQSGSERAREWADHLRNELDRLDRRNGH